MKKLEKLTDAQIAKMEKVKQYWLDYIFSCKNSIDKEKAKIGIEWMYQLAGLKAPIVIYVESPLACQYAVAYLREFIKLFPNILVDQVRDQVGAQVRDQVRAENISYEYFANYGSISDLGWISFFDFFTQIGIINHDKFNQFKSILSSGIYDMIQLNGFCIVSNLPNKISRNSNNRLHSATGPAIEFRDGYKQYYWNGVAVPSFWIENPEQIGNSTITSEKNAERRRCLREIVGAERFSKMLGIEEIDRDNVNGQDVVLYKSVTPDEVTSEHIYYVQVTCHSTGRNYFLCVPEEATKNAWSVISWSFGMNEKEYRPTIEA